MRYWALLWLALSTASAQAAVYTYVDANGNRVFTDQPGQGAKRVPMPERSSSAAPATVAPPRTSKVPVPNKAPAMRYQMLRILGPLPDTAVREEDGSLIVTLTSEPALQPNHRYRLLLDGEVAQAPGRSPVFALSNVDRGTHSLAAEIIDQDDHVIERTPAQPVHLQRISLIQKRRVHPCRNADYGVRPECPLKDKPEDD
ncbi:DUF4124 domain-containing protein [Pseudomonas rhizosphaerae]|jgi:hypothetical protein|uniref:Penicillin-binding protein n=1 Tax=Pseudomonas rhizosphaerae TaxID=216142 RepID=A0A089YYK5_9PSED|nr:DUF4124 domain-containing protein [Pseudomonas rhizosphaerae]AIS18570.1 penicillin-binding protein [Pseudomonas rhizosphaerae]MEB2872738.1 DUF4124 domain-containing protein [Pseudomonas rhizosphaerae]